MNNKNLKQKEFLECLMHKERIAKEKRFSIKEDHYKRKLRYYRDDLYSFSIMTEEEREIRHEKLFDLCQHFATISRNNDNENIYNFWPPYFNMFMTPKMFDLIPNEWFTQEFGFCFACKHFKGQKKGHHRFFHSLQKRKVIGLFGQCNKYKNMKTNKLYVGLFRYNNHVMPVYRCRGWEPAKFYEQLLKHRITKILLDDDKYTIEDFNMEQNRINILSFLGVTDDTDEHDFGYY